MFKIFEVPHPTITKLEPEVFNLHFICKFEGLGFYLNSTYKHNFTFLLRKPPDNSTL